MPLRSSVDFVYLISTWFIVGLLIVELQVKIGLNPVHQFGIVENHDLYEEISSRQRGTALSVASLVLAGLAIILSDSPQELTRQIEILSGAFGLLLIAAFAHELTRTYRIVLTFQEMALEYGLLLMVYGLYLLVGEFVPDAGTVMLVVFLAVFGFRFLSVWGELQAHKLEFEANDFESRREYFRQLFLDR